MADRTYPRHVHSRGGVYRIVSDAETDAQALSDGWVDHPLPEWGVPETYREWDGQPIEDAPVEGAPKKRGRPRKPQELIV